MDKKVCFICGGTKKGLYSNININMGKYLCVECEEISSGLEDYFDSHYVEYNEEAVKIIKKINADTNLFKKAINYRKGGKYLPNDFIEKLRK